MAQLRKREEIDSRYKWNLTHIYPDLAAWEKDYADVSQLVEAYAAYDGHVAENPRQAIRDYFALQDRLTPVYCYAFLRQEADNADSEAQALKDRAMSLIVKAETAGSFLQPELLAMDEAALKAIMDDPDMADYSAYLRSMLLEKPHTLPKEQEKLIAMMGELAQSPDHIYTMLTSVDMKFPSIHMPDGTEQPLTEGTFSSYIRSQDRDVRRQAFEGIMGTYRKFGNTVAATYAASVKTDTFQANAHRYASARAAAMEPLEIPEAVYDNLIAVIHENLPVLQEYLQLRKQAMGLDELHMFDLYTPMVSDFKMELSYEKAFDMVLEGLQPMGEDYIAKLREARDGGWIDVFPSENKSSGAFSMGSLRNVHPYVLLNHNDNLSDTFTIAHELGHAMHSYYSNLHQPGPKSDYSLFVAEVASTCNEAVMMRHLLKTLPDRKAQAYLLNHMLEQFRTTCFRQTMFAEFERISHDMAAKGQPLTCQSLSKAYYDLNQTYYGATCTVDEFIASEWMRIPHFYRAFYVYVYATGLCAAMTLSERILTEGETAVADYRKFLSAGCSVPPIEALKLAGIDMSKPEPLRKAMGVFKDALAQFKAVL